MINIGDFLLLLSDEPQITELRRLKSADGKINIVWENDKIGWSEIFHYMDFFEEAKKGQHQYLTRNMSARKADLTVIAETFEAWGR